MPTWIAIVVLAFATAASLGDASSTGKVAARSPISQPCFGAASRDPEHPCDNPRLRLVVDPTPRAAFKSPNWRCNRLPPQGPIEPCTFGVSSKRAAGTVALVGDSHAAHWRAAVDSVARAKHWYGISLMRPGCPFSTALERLREELRRECVSWHRALPGWFRRHPGVSTVFTVAESGARWVVPRGRSSSGTEVNGFIQAWRRLPSTVKRLVVIRDTPKDPETTVGCIERAMARRRPAGQACAVPRRKALVRDPAVVAAARMHSPRVQAIDLTHFFCDRRRCFPVVGAALVHKDTHHLTVVFVRTLGPYLLRAFDRLPVPPGAPG
jgi:SGNH domain-containing protein